jgi:hypothetical protein
LLAARDLPFLTNWLMVGTRLLLKNNKIQRF